MHGNTNDRRTLEREALRNVINQWNANRLDLFELSEPNEDLEFHGVMRFYFQDSGQKVATKCIRVASDATVEDVIGTLVEKFRPDMRMLSVPSYALYELHEGCPERRMSPDEKPLLVQLNWHVDDREGRFLLKNIDDKIVNSMQQPQQTIDTTNASFRRKLSKREKKHWKKQEKLNRMKGGDKQDGVADKLYTELPETSFTRSISNPEAVMRRRRQQKLEKRLQQFRSKDGGPDTGGTLKIYGEALCKDVPYKTLLLSIRDCAGAVVREMLEKYGISKADPSQWCLVQVTQQPGAPDTEYVLDDDECPLSILMNSPNTGSIMFHVRRRPADCAPRKRKKKPGVIGSTGVGSRGDFRGGDTAPLLVELGPDGSAPHPSDTTRTIRLLSDVMEVGSANGIALQLYGPHIQPRHCVITNTDGVTSLTPCHADAHTYVNGQRIHQTTILTHGSLVKFGNSNTYRFLDPVQEDRTRYPVPNLDNARIYDSRSPRPLSPNDPTRENIETTFDIEGNIETISTHSGNREDNRSLGSSSENRLSGMDRYPRGQDPILPAVLEFPEDPQEQFLARVITHLDVTTPTFRLAPAYTLYLCARYRASTHYRPELTPTERAHKLTLLLQHAAMLIRHTIQDRSTESTSQAFWLANASELLHFLKSDRHVSAFSLQAQDTLADAVQLAFKNLVACLTDELNQAMNYLLSLNGDEHPREIINVLSGAMNLLRMCRANAALTIQLFSQMFHWISAKALTNVISNSNLCTRMFGVKLLNRLRNLQAWAESQGLELAAECHLAKIVQCAHLLQAPKYTAEDLANLSAACFKLNSLQLHALLMEYKAEAGEKIASQTMLEQAAKAAESVADELARAEGRELTLFEDPAPPLQLLLPDDGFSCDVVQGVPPGLADFLHPLQASGLCRLAAQPTSSGHWTVYMTAPRPPSALSTTQPEIQMIRLHKAGGGMGLSIVAAKGAGQERLGIYIKSVVPGGAADRDGRLAAGDQLLSVDGQSLLGITQEKAAEFLVRTGSIVTLEVAKGGAVYHGLATLLQQPSPTPHRATDIYYGLQGSQESLNNDSYHIFTPPAIRPKMNVFFSSDDSLFKTEKRKFTIPRIEIESDEPVFSLQVTDFTEPTPKNITLTYDETGTNMKMDKIEDYVGERANKSVKACSFMQQKSYSIDVHENDYNIDQIDETDKFLSIGRKKFRQQQRIASASLQDLSSSTSSINSAVHESNLDLSQIDPDTPIKQRNWKSPYEIRHGKEFDRQFDNKAISVPILNKRKTVYSRSKSVSEEKLDNKLTEYERMEILKLLYDWSLSGSESKTELKVDLKRNLSKANSYPDLSPNKTPNNEMIFVAKYKSESNLSNTNVLNDFLHKCQFRNCIFNVDYVPKGTNETECLNNKINVENKAKHLRRNSEIVVKKETPTFNSHLIRSDSLNDLKPKEHKKFPDAYIVTRHKSSPKKKHNESVNKPKSPKIIVLRKKYIPNKTWKSCSDIKIKRTVRKCCRYAKKTCPVLKNSPEDDGKTARKTQSCANIEHNHDLDTCARLDPLPGAFNCPRRMSERDLPSRVDSERTILSSKSVPALHHISPNSEQRTTLIQQHQQPPHDVFNPGYSRTSSSNSINTNSTTPAAQLHHQNGQITNNSATGVRSRSTHNLHQQQDAGFYQNLSVYRNKLPSPQQLGDRTSALRSSQNSLQSSVVSQHQPVQQQQQQQRPASAYYSHPITSIPSRPNLHQSIPNLKSPPAVHRMHSEENRSGSYPSVNYPVPNQNYPSPTYPNYPQNTNISQPLHINANGQRLLDERYTNSNVGGGLLREDVFRQSHNVRLKHETEMRTSKSEDLLKQHQPEMVRYASSANVRQHENLAQMRGQAKMMEMSEEVRRRQNRMNNANFYPAQQQYYNQQQQQMVQSMQNLNMNHGNYYGGNVRKPPESPLIAAKPNNVRKMDDVPEPPPTSTHPLYSASASDPPKMSFYTASSGQTLNKPPRDPWAREEHERQQEARREAARQWQEQQIQELLSLPYRTQQQEEQLRVLQLEKEFQRRALEAAEQDDDDTEKDSPTLGNNKQESNVVMAAAPPLLSPTSILKAGQSPPEATVPVMAAPPPPERGSSFTVMSMRAKESTKRVSFNDTSTSPVQQQPPTTLPIEESVREDPNSFIRQAESMLASPTTPNDSMAGNSTATPGVIGAQEVYRDPRAKRLAEQAQQKNQNNASVPEKLSFKEKMKMFAMETGEQGTPKDKSKISRAQREIDNLSTPPTSSLVH